MIMNEFSDLEPMIITSHDKGPKRGIALYFGVKELNELQKVGINLREHRRFILRTTMDHKIVLIPLSELEVHFEIEEKLDLILGLNQDEKEEFAEELLNIITDSDVKIGEKERYSIYQITKNHFTRYNIRNAIRIGLRANKNATQDLLNNIFQKKEVL